MTLCVVIAFRVLATNGGKVDKNQLCPDQPFSIKWLSARKSSKDRMNGIPFPEFFYSDWPFSGKETLFNNPGKYGSVARISKPNFFANKMCCRFLLWLKYLRGRCVTQTNFKLAMIPVLDTSDCESFRPSYIQSSYYCKHFVLPHAHRAGSPHGVEPHSLLELYVSTHSAL